MFFESKDKKIEITELTLADNLSTYHSVITFASPAKLYTSDGKITMNNTSGKIDVSIESQELMDNGLMKVCCVTKFIHDAFDSITNGFNGWTTINKLFSRLGYDYKSNFASNNTYFSIPQCSVVSMFDKLTECASFANGGGAHFYMQSDGVIYGYDYKLIKDKSKPKVINGQIVSECIELDWLDYIPSQYELLYWNNENKFKRENLVLEKGFGKMVVYVNDTTGIYKEVKKQELTNLFYNRWYSSHKVLVGTADEVKLGDLVNLNNLGNTYIVKGINMSYTEVQATPSVTIELVSNPKFE